MWLPESVSGEHCVLVWNEKFKETIDRGNEFGVLLTDLSNAFSCLNNPPLIEKICSYGVSSLSREMITSYLSNRTQWTKNNESFTKGSHKVPGVQQCSILGPVLVNIDLINLFYECEESNIASYVILLITLPHNLVQLTHKQ